MFYFLIFLIIFLHARHFFLFFLSFFFFPLSLLTHSFSTSVHRRSSPTLALPDVEQLTLSSLTLAGVIPAQETCGNGTKHHSQLHETRLFLLRSPSSCQAGTSLSPTAAWSELLGLKSSRSACRKGDPSRETLPRGGLLRASPWSHGQAVVRLCRPS